MTATSPYLTVAQVADRLHLAKSSVYQLTSKRRIPFRKPAGTNGCLFLVSDLESWERGAELVVHENPQGGLAVLPRKERANERTTQAA